MARLTQKHNLEVVNPSLAKEWHPTKNGTLTPKLITPMSGKKVWWICNKGHEWEAYIFSRNKGSRCPYCSAQLATKEHNLQIINPHLAKQWHPAKNGALTPTDVTPVSGKKVWWMCGKGHEWEARVASRTNGGGCPYCSGRRVCDDNCLQTVNSSLTKEWHPSKNGSLTPRDITPGSGKKAWWICDKGHEWKSSIFNRSYGYGCPYCAREKRYKVHNDNCLQTVNPALAAEWHPTRNGSLTPKDVVSHSTKRVWWNCGKGHEWEALVNNRSNGTGCPYCARERKSNGQKT